MEIHQNQQDMQTKYVRLTDAQWEVIKEFLNWQRKRKLDLRNVFDAILYITRTGIQWRNLPEEMFPDWQAVYYYFDKWKKEKTIEKINMALNAMERRQKERKPTPSLGFVDSQSIKLTPMIYEQRGIDGNKKVNGRKRHILVDVLGRIYQAHVHAANLHDSPQGVKLLDFSKEDLNRLEKIMGDNTYKGSFARAVEKMELKFGTPNRPENTKGFVVEAKRWVVERTFAWLNFFRRTVVDYEHTPQSSASFLLLANISICLWRIKF